MFGDAVEGVEVRAHEHETEVGFRRNHAEREQLRIGLGANVLHEGGQPGFRLQPLLRGEKVPLAVFEAQKKMQHVAAFGGEDWFHVRNKFRCPGQKNNCNPGGGF